MKIAACASARFTTRRITADPKDKDVVYILNTGLYKSTDGGKTVKQLRPRHGDQHDLWIASNDPHAHDQFQRRRRECFGQRRRNLDRTKTIPPRSCITSPPPWTFPITCAARSRTTPPSASPARRRAAAAGGTGGEYLGRPVYSPGGGESGYIAPDPKKRRHFLRRQPGRAAHRLRSQNRPPARRAGVSAVFLRHAVERAQGALAVDFPDRLQSRRSENSVHFVAASVEDHQSGPELGDDQSRI